MLFLKKQVVGKEEGISSFSIRLKAKYEDYYVFLTHIIKSLLYVKIRNALILKPPITIL